MKWAHKIQLFWMKLFSSRMMTKGLRQKRDQFYFVPSNDFGWDFSIICMPNTIYNQWVRENGFEEQVKIQLDRWNS